MRTRLIRLVVGVAVLSLAASACGNTKKSTNTSTATTEVNTKPTGAAIVLGAVSNDGNASNSPETTDGVVMAADYLNEHGGIAGHPVEVHRCDEAGDAEKHQACVRGFIDDKSVMAVVPGTPRQAAIGIPFLEQAKMPVFWPSPGTAAELKSSTVMTFSGGNPIAYGVLAKQFLDTGKKNFTVLAIQAASIPPLVALYDKFLAQYSLGPSKLVQYPASTTDFAPTATAAVAQKPDAILTITSPAHFGSIVRSLRDVGYTGIIASARSGFTTQSLATAGSASDGVLTVLDVPTEDAVKDQAGKDMYSRYNAAVKKKGISPSGGSLNGFVGMFAVKGVIEKVGYDKLTRDALYQFIQNKGEVTGVPLLPKTLSRSLAPPNDADFLALGNPFAYVGEVQGGNITTKTGPINPFVKK